MRPLRLGFRLTLVARIRNHLGVAGGWVAHDGLSALRRTFCPVDVLPVLDLSCVPLLSVKSHSFVIYLVDVVPAFAH